MDLYERLESRLNNRIKKNQEEYEKREEKKEATSNRRAYNSSNSTNLIKSSSVPIRKEYTASDSGKNITYNLPVANDFKRQLETGKRVKFQNTMDLTLPEAVSIGTDVVSSIHAGKMNADLDNKKYSRVVGNNIRNNFYGGMANTVSGVVGAVAVPIGEKIKKVGNLLGTEKLQKWGNTWQDSAKIVQDVSNYSSKVNSKINNDVVKTVGQVSNTIGNMAPGLALTYLTGGGRSYLTSYKFWRKFNGRNIK